MEWMVRHACMLWLVYAERYGWDIEMPEFRVFRSEILAGYFSDEGRPSIWINEKLFSPGNEGELIDTLKHETVHLIQWNAGRTVCHDSYFRRIARGIGIDVSGLAKSLQHPLPERLQRF